MLYGPIDFVQKNSNSASLTILLYRLFTLLPTDGDNNNAAVIMEGDAENARHENARNAIVWNTACYICLSIAEQECMSRQERAPDLAANCGCPICRSEITMVLRLY